jgi:hypothetical protein
VARPKQLPPTNMSCYRCGQKGHIASNPKCPQYQACPTHPHVNAQQVLNNEVNHPEGESQSAVHDNTYQYADSWGGSQFKSQQDYPDHHSHSDGADTALEGEDGDDEGNNHSSDDIINEDNDCSSMGNRWVAVACA